MFKVINVIIDLMRLKVGLDEYIDVDINYSFTKDDLINTNILELNNCKIIGTISNQYDDIYLDLTIDGVMVLPCAISLKPVNYPINSKITGSISELYPKNDINVENTIDIFPIIWENILMEIPLKVVSDDLSDVKTSGDGWKLVTEDKEEKY